MRNIFINRKQELKKLETGLKIGKDYILIAPRRYGKTALARMVGKKITESTKNSFVHIDLMSYSSGSVSSVAECIIEKVLNTLGFEGKLRKIIKNLDFTFNIRIKYQELEIEPLIQMFNKPNDEWALLEEALQLPEKIAIKENKRLVIFFDEFAELNKLGKRVIELFRSVIQQHEHVSYLFAGSQESLMNDIFLDKSGAFYRFGEIIYLKELNKEDLFEYLEHNFPNIGGSKDGLRDLRVVNVILETLNGHPYYTAKAISFFEENPQCTYEQFYDYLTNDLFETERPLLEQQLLSIGDKQHAIDVLRIISLGYSPYGEIKALSTSQVYNILRYLENSGHIRKISRGVYALTDPLMSLMLNNI